MHTEWLDRRCVPVSAPTSGRRGFGMVEIVIVVIILGVIVALATPPIARSLASSSADRAAQMIGWDVRAAFSLASRQRQPVEIVVDAARMQYVIRDRATATVLRRRDLGPGSPHGASTISSSAPIITIFPNGLSDGPFQIDIWLAGQGRRVLVRRTGHVRAGVL